MHKVHFAFWLYEGIWRYQFVDQGNPLGRPFRTRNVEVIRDLATRGGGITNSESRCMLDYAIMQGKGGMYLKLTPEQYEKLKGQHLG